MAQPTPYSRQYNFTNYQTTNPSTPLPAAQVDLELNTVKSTLDQVLNNLKLIQRDDTALANNSVGKDQLKAEVTIGINPPQPWVTAHTYLKNDTVTTGGKFYVCLVSHTSGTFATDLAALDWSLIIDFGTVAFDLAGATHAAPNKATLVDQDEVSIANSESAYVLGKVTWANIKAGIFAAFGPLIAAGTAKATPVDADAFSLMDSAATNATKTLTWANLKATIFAAGGALIAAGTAKATPVGADMIEIADSAAANATKMVTLTNLFAAMFTALGPLIAAATGKSTPVDTDGLLITDSAASGASKLLTWANLKATLKTYFDTLYQPLRTILTSLGGLTIASGDVLYGSGANALSNLAKGSNGQVLTLAAGLPSWAAAAAAGQPIPTSDASTWAVGTMALLVNVSGGAVAAGGTTAGSNLQQAHMTTSPTIIAVGAVPAGTWKNITTLTSANSYVDYWVRTA